MHEARQTHIILPSDDLILPYFHNELAKYCIFPRNLALRQNGSNSSFGAIWRLQTSCTVFGASFQASFGSTNPISRTPSGLSHFQYESAESCPDLDEQPIRSDSVSVFIMHSVRNNPFKYFRGQQQRFSASYHPHRTFRLIGAILPSNFGLPCIPNSSNSSSMEVW